MKTYFKKCLFATSFFALTAPAFAEFYVGGSLGQADIENADQQTSWEIKTGYRFNEFIAVEGFYLDLGESEQGATQYGIDGVGASAIGILPIDERFELYGKLGVYAWDINRSFAGIEANTNGEDIIFGLGAAWKVTDMVKVNLGYDTVSFSDNDLDTDVYSLGATISF